MVSSTSLRTFSAVFVSTACVASDDALEDLRFFFAPLFMLCYTEHAGPLQLPVFAATDAMPYTFMFIFALAGRQNLTK